jgi:D-3-phosphoglycerate dehydrogenase
LINQSRDELAYTVIDVEQPVSEMIMEHLRNIPGVLQVRKISV